MTEAAQMYDYYYSPTQESVCIDNASRYFPPRAYTFKKFKGRSFTIMVEHGKDHGCKFDDMVLVGIGYSNDAEYSRSEYIEAAMIPDE